ncbi:MAG: hypothetical protein KDC89_08710 [Flavobacteriaceae bacterium]|nr:hypothetical protein [Flavobacteriaceae bacterium]
METAIAYYLPIIGWCMGHPWVIRGLSVDYPWVVLFGNKWQKVEKSALFGKKVTKNGKK